MEAVDDNADFELARRLQEEEIQAIQNRNENLEAPLLDQNQQDENQEPSPPSIGAVRQTLIRVIAEVQRNSPALVMIYCIYAIVEIAATTLFASAFWNQECGRDLQIWLICFTSRLFVLVPLHIWKIRDPTSAERVRQTLQYLNIIVILTFVVGQKWVFEATCRGPFYTYCFIIIMMMYATLMLPVVVLIMVILCAPALIYIFQRFRIGSQAATELELDELPQEVYEGDNDSDEEMCSICINGYDRGDQLVRLPCDHRFHRDCIASWLRIKRICPLCRHDIREPVEL